MRPLTLSVIMIAPPNRARRTRRDSSSWLLFFLHDFSDFGLDIAPRRRHAEFGAQIGGEIRKLLGSERPRKGGHPASAFAIARLDALNDDADQIARCWIRDRGTQRKIQCASG